MSYEEAHSTEELQKELAEKEAEIESLTRVIDTLEVENRILKNLVQDFYLLLRPLWINTELRTRAREAIK